MEVGEWVGIFSLILAVLIPTMGMFIKLNSTLTRLNVNMEKEHADGLRRTQRLDSHSQKLDEHEVKIANHEVRINHLERYHNKD